MKVKIFIIFLSFLLLLLIGCGNISSDPSGADVFVNGEKKGTTPLNVKLPDGKWTIKISKKGYAGFSKVVTVSKDNPLKIKATLKNLMSLKKLWVASSTGLNMRERPNPRAKKVTFLPGKTMIYQIEKTNKFYKVGSRGGYWLKVADSRGSNKIGYVVGAWVHSKKITGIVLANLKTNIPVSGHPAALALAGYGVSYVSGNPQSSSTLSFANDGMVLNDSGPHTAMVSFCAINYVVVNKIKKDNYNVYIGCNDKANINDVLGFKNHPHINTTGGMGAPSAMSSYELNVDTGSHTQIGGPPSVTISVSGRVYKFSGM